MTDEGPPCAAVPSPTAGVDPRVSLATALHAAPGVYAVLVGSGMSSAAGIPTGWQVVQDLVRKVALAEGVSDDEIAGAPEAWWVKTRGTEPRYDDLLAGLAPTDALRRALLKQYFDPPTSGGGPREPTSGHRVLADLCASGRIRVLITTNFDRLLQSALEAAGVGAQVIATADQLAGMTPLAHAPATILKLHGDFAAPMLNTAEELEEYPPKMRELLGRVFDEYGLLIVGWSAEYDRALAGAVASCPSRRYPTFWASFRGSITDEARDLIALRQATVIDSEGADELFLDVGQRLARLDARAARRGKPTPLHAFSFPPERAGTQGWTGAPRLRLSATACIAPATIDDSGPIGPREHDRVLNVLRAAPISTALHGLFFSIAPVVGGDGAPSEPPSAKTLEPWGPTPGAYQSGVVASYRFGGDAAEAVSALATIHLPGFAHGGWVVFTIDIGLPFVVTRLAEVARLWRDGLILTSSLLPEAIAEIIPADADVVQAEFHALAGPGLGHDGTPGQPLDLGEPLELGSLGPPTRAVGPSMGFAVRLSQAPADREAAEIVVEAIYQTAIAHGYRDPRNGIAALRAELGLPPAAGLWA